MGAIGGLRGKRKLEVLVLGREGELNLSGNAVGFLVSPEGSLEGCGHAFKVRLITTVEYSSSSPVPVLSHHHIQQLRTIVKEEGGKGVAVFARELL